MSLTSQISSAFTRVGTEFKTIRTLIGGSGTADISSLTTANKTSLVAAINEVKASSSGAPPQASTTAAGVVELATTSEATTGTDTERAVTPAGVAAAVAGKANTSALSAVALSGNAADLTGTLPTSVLPPIAIKDTFTVGSQAAMLALTAQRGDVAIRTDQGNKMFMLVSDSPGTLGDWLVTTGNSDVQSVAGRTGAVVLTKSDVGLANVDNTSDANKPVSAATQTALNGKQPIDTDLTAIAALTSAADRVPYATGAGTWSLATFTATGRALVACTTVSDVRSVLSVYTQAEVGDPATDFVAVFNTALA